jgi:hypothetical protein
MARGPSRGYSPAVEEQGRHRRKGRNVSRTMSLSLGRTAMGGTDADRRFPFIIVGLSQLDVQEQLSWSMLPWAKHREKDIVDEFRGQFLADLLSEELLDQTSHS